MNENKNNILKGLNSFLTSKNLRESLEITFNDVENKNAFDLALEFINNSIFNFSKAIEEESSAQELQQIIKNGLEKFDAFDLDTESREQICEVYQDIMDIINLESSDGIINTWLYGFDPYQD